MADFTVHNEQTAPEQARPMLAAAKRRLGFVSTLSGVMAESPELLAGYNTLSDLFTKSSLPGPAKQIVLLTASVANECRHCVAAHSTMTLRGPGLGRRGQRRRLSGRRVHAQAGPGRHPRRRHEDLVQLHQPHRGEPLDLAWAAQEWAPAPR